MPETVADWVLGTDSLTARLRGSCGQDFAVRVLSEGWQRPLPDERACLRLHRQRLAWVREVALCCDRQPLIVARSVIPRSSLRAGNQALRLLGTRPLGELLFSGAGSRRERLQLARLRQNDDLAERLRVQCGQPVDGQWARRVVHYLRHKPLLVTEVFLPELVESDE